MKTYKITYTYVITTIKTGEIEVEAENADEARQEVSDNQREYDLYDASSEIDESRTFEIDDVQEVSNDKLTEKEKMVLQAYIEDEFCDSGVESTLWADAFSDNLKARGLNARTRSGVLSSLNKKGYIISKSGYRDAVLMLTEKGKEYIKKTFNIA